MISLPLLSHCPLLASDFDRVRPGLRLADRPNDMSGSKVLARAARRHDDPVGGSP
jgi:hypothetical protein